MYKYLLYVNIYLWKCYHYDHGFNPVTVLNFALRVKIIHMHVNFIFGLFIAVDKILKIINSNNKEIKNIISLENN